MQLLGLWADGNLIQLLGQQTVAADTAAGGSLVADLDERQYQ